MTTELTTSKPSAPALDRQVLVQATIDDWDSIRQAEVSLDAYVKFAKKDTALRENMLQVASDSVLLKWHKGRILRNMAKNTGAMGIGGNQDDVRLQAATTPTYIELGIEKTEAHREQVVADAFTEDEIIAMCAELREQAKIPTFTQFLRLAKRKKLAAESTPPEVRDKAVEMANAGEKITMKVAEGLIEDAKPKPEPEPDSKQQIEPQLPFDGIPPESDKADDEPTAVEEERESEVPTSSHTEFSRIKCHCRDCNAVTAMHMHLVQGVLLISTVESKEPSLHCIQCGANWAVNLIKIPPPVTPRASVSKKDQSIPIEQDIASML